LLFTCTFFLYYYITFLILPELFSSNFPKSTFRSQNFHVCKAFQKYSVYCNSFHNSSGHSEYAQQCTRLWSDQRVSQGSLSVGYYLVSCAHSNKDQILLRTPIMTRFQIMLTTFFTQNKPVDYNIKFGRHLVGYSVEDCYYKGNHTGISYYSGTPTETSYIQQSHTDKHLRHIYGCCCYSGNVTEIRYYSGTPIQTRYYSNTHQLLSFPQKQDVILSSHTDQILLLPQSSY
jgi:hypothetical protein